MATHHRYTVAVDLGKRAHVATLLEAAAGDICETIRFSVDAQGFAAFEARLRACSVDVSDFLIGCEATGHYGETLIRRLQHQGYLVVRLNPAQVVQFRRGLGRRAKTDQLDAQAMALQLAVTEVTPEESLSPTVRTLRRLTRLHHNFVTERSRWVNRVRGLINQMFPEIEPLLGHITDRTTLTLLAAYPSRLALATAPLVEVTQLVESASRKNKGQAYAHCLLEAARTSVGLDDVGLQAEMTFVVRQLTELTTMIKELDTDITALVDQLLAEYSAALGLVEPLTIESFPYGSYLSLGTLLAEIGAIERFASLKQLLGYFGWCPNTRESGESSMPHSRMSRQGNRFARRILWLLAVGAVRWVAEYRQYYTQRVAAGKNRMKTLVAVGRKLLGAIVATLRTGQPYNPEWFRQQAQPVAT